MSVFDQAVSRTYRAIIAFDDQYGFGDHQHLAMEIVRKLAEDGLLIMDPVTDDWMLPQIVFAWECPHCGAAVEDGERGELLPCSACHNDFVRGAE